MNQRTHLIHPPCELINPIIPPYPMIGFGIADCVEDELNMYGFKITLAAFPSNGCRVGFVVHEHDQLITPGQLASLDKKLRNYLSVPHMSAGAHHRKPLSIVSSRFPSSIGVGDLDLLEEIFKNNEFSCFTVRIFSGCRQWVGPVFCLEDNFYDDSESLLTEELITLSSGFNDPGGFDRIRRFRLEAGMRMPDSRGGPP